SFSGRINSSRNFHLALYRICRRSSIQPVGMFQRNVLKKHLKKICPAIRVGHGNSLITQRN
ncbi:MAG: hypothetical protein LBQ66_13245, partial [Planctomycetaceae bacterium]|nr:hypothetical protein [Planctomycetaceae bacterium]